MGLMRKKSKRDEEQKRRPSVKDRNRAFVCTMNGPHEVYIENYGSLGDYSEKKVVLHACKSILTIEGEGLLIDYFTDIDMKITGRIRAIHL